MKGLDIGGNSPLSLSCLHPRAGTTMLLTFAVSGAWADSVPCSFYGYDVFGRSCQSQLPEEQ